MWRTLHDALVCASLVPVELRVITKRLSPPQANVRKSSVEISTSSPTHSA